MRQRQTGLGLNGYHQDSAIRAVRTSIRIVEDQSKRRLSKMTESGDFISHKQTKSISYRQKEGSANRSNNNPYQDISEKTSDSSSNSSSSDQDKSIEIKSLSRLKIDRDSDKNRFNFKTDKKQMQLREQRRCIKRSVSKEIKKVEKMFPISLISSQSKKISRNESIQQLCTNLSLFKTVKEGKFNHQLDSKPNPYNTQSQSSKYFNNSSFNAYKTTNDSYRPSTSTTGLIQTKTTSVLLKKGLTQSQNQNEDSFLSDISDVPYKLMPEKKIMFKILDKHQQVLTNRKKRQDQLYRVGFTKGIFNDSSLAWDMRNNSTRSSNFIGLKVLQTATKDRSNIADIRNPESQRDKRLRSAKQISIKEESEKSILNLKRNKSVKLFEDVKKIQAGLIDECLTARKDIRLEKKKFQVDEDYLKRLINVQKRQEGQVMNQRIKLEEAENFAKIVSSNNHQLRRKIFQNALQEFKDEEYQEIRNKEIEKSLNDDYKKRSGYQY